ncbi:MAG: S49 family peptidase [Rhodospirillaceae bacterium]|nr:S49 family peptidase [Rhodospirillaceae bacterium]
MDVIDRLNDFLADRGIVRATLPTPSVSVVRLQGLIGAVGMGRRGLSLTALEPILKKAFSRHVRAVCLQINSPGGSPVQSAQIAGRIRQLSKDNKIPVFAFAEDIAASGGYWLALAADEIYADAMSVVGSIGVISAGFGFQDLISKMGVERRVHAQGAHKSFLDPFKPENPEDVARLDAIQKDIHRQFTTFVRKRRGERLTAADEAVFNGDIWTGERALELGLVDGLGDLRTIMRRKYGPDVRFLIVERPMSWLERRLGRVGGSGLESADARIGWASDLISAVEERAHWARFGL